MEKQHRKNLQLLSNHLRHKVELENFNMRVIRGVISGDGLGVLPLLTDFESFMEGECGTVGCALGSGSDVPELAVAREDRESTDDGDEVDWVAYCRRLYGIDYNSDLWDFLFSGLWAKSEFDGPVDAANRIDLLLKYDGDFTELLEEERNNPQVRWFEWNVK